MIWSCREPRHSQKAVEKWLAKLIQVEESIKLAGGSGTTYSQQNRRARKFLRSQMCAAGLGTEFCNVHRQSQHPRLSAYQCPKEEFLTLGPSFLLVIYTKPSGKQRR